MDNNINLAPKNADNSSVLKTSADFDYSKDNAAVQKKSVVSINEVSLVEKVNAKNATNEQEEKEVSENEINKALEVVSSFMNSSNKQIAFSNDNTSGKTVITITDKKTQEVINQFPSDKIILMAERIQDLHREAESISGLLIDSRV
jgi:flagellar protein FlaG